MNPSPDHEPGTPLDHQVATWGHRALYAIMIIMPITGYYGTDVATKFFFLFDITKFPNTILFTHLVEQGLGVDFKNFEEPLDFVHKKIMGEWLVWILILGHILAALYHHFIKKDRTLDKMTVNKTTT
jgi:cytochrome b561